LLDGLEEQALFTEFSHEDDLIEIWSIGDTSLPAACQHSINQICISSPGKIRNALSGQLKFWTTNKQAMTITVPPCSWDEILGIRRALFGDDGIADVKCPLEALRDNFDTWGGVPRTIILGRPSWLEQMEQDLKQLKIRDALQYMGTHRLDHVRHSGAFFHLFPGFQAKDEDFEGMSLYDKYTAPPSFWWATPTLERKACGYFRSQQEDEVIDYIETLGNDPGVRGKAWEEKIHHLISTCGLKGT
jgi:hypothetical protein